MKILRKKQTTIGLILLTTVVLLFSLSSAHAMPLNQRSVEISSSTPSAPNVSQLFSFYPSSNASVSSLTFQYCTNSSAASDPCVAPTGFNITSAVLSSQSGNAGFMAGGSYSTANKLVLTRAPAVFNPVLSTYYLTNITNPATPGITVYVRMASHASADGTGPSLDEGSVAFSIQGGLLIGSSVPPFIRMCVGITVEINCSTGSGDSLDLGSLSNANASSGVSQFAVGTNDLSGYGVYVAGTTLTSGNNTVPALESQGASIPGAGQFGINLRQNTAPSVGAEPDGSGSAVPTAGYNAANLYQFIPGDLIASSSLASDFNRMTVSYLVNVPKNQPAGIYSTTVTYIAVAQF